MVHLEDAHSANPTVMGAIRLILQAPLTLPSLPRALLFLSDVQSRIHGDGLGILGAIVLPGRVLLFVGDCPGMDEDAQEVAHKKHQGDGMESCELPRGCGGRLAFLQSGK